MNTERPKLHTAFVFLQNRANKQNNILHKGCLADAGWSGLYFLADEGLLDLCFPADKGLDLCFLAEEGLSGLCFLLGEDILCVCCAADEGLLDQSVIEDKSSSGLSFIADEGSLGSFFIMIDEGSLALSIFSDGCLLGVFASFSTQDPFISTALLTLPKISSMLPLLSMTTMSIYTSTVLPAKSDSDFMFCLQSY